MYLTKTTSQLGQSLGSWGLYGRKSSTQKTIIARKLNEVSQKAFLFSSSKEDRVPLANADKFNYNKNDS